MENKVTLIGILGNVNHIGGEEESGSSSKKPDNNILYI